MEELFGVSMDLIMAILLAFFLASMAVVGWMAWRSPVMVKLGLRNIPRRMAQTVLIIVGIMISTLIMAAAFGTGDTISYSIRSNAVEALGPIDEIIISARATSGDSFGSTSYIPYERFLWLRDRLTGLESIDGLSPGIGEWAPAVNTRTSLSEGQMRIAGVEPASLRGFGALYLASGAEVRLESLGQDEAYINTEAAEELGAVAGDVLQVFVAGRGLPIEVMGVVDRGGLAGDGPTLVVRLDHAQSMFDRDGQINSIVVSNLGGTFAGAELSDEVTRELRVLFADRAVAAQLKELLGRGEVLRALESRERSLSANRRPDMSALLEVLQRDEVSDRLISLLADERVFDDVLEALSRGKLAEAEREADTLFAGLGEFRVHDVKKRVLDLADQVGSGVTSTFVIMGLFSIMVGVLLIFLIFVMLAAARRSEMGMARAVGAKRRHLVQMFVFEGTAYALASGAVGVFLGLAASATIVAIANWIFANGVAGTPENFHLTPHFEVRSAIVAYCLGMVITLGTVAVSAYRVSRMNIVVAIRGLPETIVVRQDSPLSARLLGILKAVARPAIFFIRGLTNLAHARFGSFFLNMGLAVLWVAVFPIWGFGFVNAVFRFAWPYLRQGWLTFLVGAWITWGGMASDQAAPFGTGVSLAIVGIGLMLRTALWRTSLRAEVRDRTAYSFIGGLMLAFWLMPFDTLSGVTGEFNSGIEMFFISGIATVAAAVWTVMYNADHLLKAMTLFIGRVGRLRPVLVTAVAYPMSAKFRTGLTLAMFALVIFTLIVISILNNAFSAAVADVDAVAGGWDIQGIVNFNTPIGDIRGAIDDHPDLFLEDFEAVGGYTTIPVEARQTGAENQRWRRYAVRAAGDDFLRATESRLKLIADGYGKTDREVWQALRDDPTLAVVDSLVVPTRSGFGDSGIPFQLEGVYYEDEEMSPIELEVREPRTGQVVRVKVIGVMDRLTDAFGNIGLGMFVSRRQLDETVPFPIPTTTYRFKVAEGVDMARTARSIEAAFRENGMETDVLAELVGDQAAANRAFNYLFTGYMGLGLMVGIAALGVVSLRAVVERRQHIGVMRAIGYRRRMVQLSFLLESSFVVLLGVAIGVALGTIMSFNIVNDIQDDVESIRFSIPWVQIGVIIAVAYLFSLATTFLPALQASRIFPAEALRYE
ncbi:MAG TPA: FtsX-like permease family protein [Dehalococcoidia bacterium]|nr:FtsX-like permease family protein [Dehalococcoidia bacterium]